MAQSLLPCGRCVRQVIVATWLAGILAIPAQTWAEASADERALAEALFRDARVLMNDGKASDACPKLVESNRLDPGGGTQLLLGLCLEQDGRMASAWVELNEALSMAIRDDNEARISVARAHLATVEPRLNKLRLVFPEDPMPDGSTLELQGSLLPTAAWSTPLPVDPGEHELVVSAPDHTRVVVLVAVEGEGNVITVSIPQLEVKPTAEPPIAPEKTATGSPQRPPPPAETEPTAGRSNRSTWAWTIGGIGAASTIAGAVFGAQAITLNNQVNDACPGVGATCDDDWQDEHDQAKTSATLSTVFFGVGLVGLGTATYLLLTGDPADKDLAKGTSPRGQAFAVDTACVAPTDGGARFQIRGTF